jgi:amidase
MYQTSNIPPDGLATAELIRKGSISRIEAMHDAIKRIRRANGQLNALVDDLGEQALETASLENVSNRCFSGVPTLVKDLFMPVQGARMTNGSLIGREAVAPFDAEVVARLRATGAVILGTTTSPEFGTSFATESHLSGVTRNPWSLDHTPGGSSGGSAAMVAARAVPFALGNDGGGSLRVPASCCGIFALKPSRGRVPMGPMVGEGWAGMGCNNVMSISVRDSAAMLDALSGMDTGAPYAAPHDPEPLLAAIERRPKGLRIGFVRHLPPFESDPECLVAAEDTAQLCLQLGHNVDETELPVDAMEYYDTVFTIIGAQTRSFLTMIGRVTGTPVNEADLEPRTRVILREKGDVRGAEYAAAVDYIHAFGRRMGHLLERYDLLLTPTLAQLPVQVGHFTIDDDDSLANLIHRSHSFSPFTSLANASGQPAMSVPLYWSSQGLPVGSHFWVGLGKEALLFSLAGQLEEARPWAGRIPPVNAISLCSSS